jgi:hypothetical protein
VFRPFLAFICPCIASIYLKYNQKDATFFYLFIYINCFTCFRRFLRPSSGAHNCTYSIWYCQTTTAASCVQVCPVQVEPTKKEYICNMYHKMAVPGDSLYEQTHVGETLRNNKKIFIIKDAVNWNKYFTL